MKLRLLTGTALALLPAMATASERGPAPWTGFYVGGQIGGVWTKAGLSGAYENISDGSTWSSTQSWSSFLIGGFAGYDMRFGRMVLGVEGDVNARLGEGTAALPSAYGIIVTSGWKSRADWDASIRGRIGILATETLLLYATGGVAFSHFKFSNAGVTTVDQVYWNSENLYGGARIGWAIGAGAQFAMTRSWNVRIEYRHTNYGEKTKSGTYDFNKSGPGSYRAKITDDRVTAGLAYKF